MSDVPADAPCERCAALAIDELGRLRAELSNHRHCRKEIETLEILVEVSSGIAQAMTDALARERAKRDDG